MYKNIASQYIIVRAWDSATGLAKTDDAAQITAFLSKDTVAGVATNDVNPTEITNKPGAYAFLMTQAETNADLLSLTAVSSTGGIVLDPVEIYTIPVSVAQTGDNYVRLGAPAGADISADIAANLAAIGLIGVGSASVSKIADSFTATAATETGTYADTSQLDGTTHDLAPPAGTLDGYYEFEIGGGNTGSLIGWDGYVNTAGDELIVQAYDWAGTAWTQIGSISGSPGSVVNPEFWDLDTRHTGTGVNTGKVRVRFYSTGGTIVTNVSTDRLLCSYAVTSQSVGYANGGIWIDTLNGTPGTVDYVNGTADNKVDNLADALVLAASLGMNKFITSQGSTLTFAGSMVQYEFGGIDYFVELGGQQIDNITVTGAYVSGIASGNGGTVFFERNQFGDCSFPDMAAVQGIFTGTITAVESGIYFFDHCSSAIAGAGAPVFDFNHPTVVGAVSLNLRHYSGGIEIRNMEAGDSMSLEGDGQFIIDISCTGGDLSVRGNFKKTDNSGDVIIDETANNYSGIVESGKVQASTNNTLTLAPTASPVDGTYDPSIVQISSGTGSGQTRTIYQYDGTTKIAVLDRDWKTNPDTTSDYLIIANPGREHVNEGQARDGTATTMQLNISASAVDGEYVGQTVFLRSGTGQDQVKIVLGYVGATRTITVQTWDTIPDTTTGYVMLPIFGTDLAGFQQAILALTDKTASNPSWFTGTYDPAEDSLEAISESVGEKIPASITYIGELINVITFEDGDVWTHNYTGTKLTSITVS